MDKSSRIFGQINWPKEMPKSSKETQVIGSTQLFKVKSSARDVTWFSGLVESWQSLKSAISALVNKPKIGENEFELPVINLSKKTNQKQ